MSSLPGADARSGILSVRPRPAAATSLSPGVHALGLGRERDAAFYLPKSYDPQTGAPVVVLLHGAGGHATQLLDPFVEVSEARGLLLLAPDSRGRTWDVIIGGYGPDVAFMDRALGWVYERCNVDPRRIAIAGFSDGASYALSLGLSNGEMFSDVLAFSPGYMAPSRQAGRPRIFISHGVRDEVLPIDPCSRRIAAALRGGGYDLEYREFEGGHSVPPEMVTAAAARFLT